MMGHSGATASFICACAWVKCAHAFVIVLVLVLCTQVSALNVLMPALNVLISALNVLMPAFNVLVCKQACIKRSQLFFWGSSSILLCTLEADMSRYIDRCNIMSVE